MESFLFDMHKFYYLDLVGEYYVNLKTDKFGNCMFMVNGKKIHLNLHVLSSILKIENDTKVDVFTVQWFVTLLEFSVVG